MSTVISPVDATEAVHQPPVTEASKALSSDPNSGESDGDLTGRMRQLWDAEVMAGRVPSGAELTRHVGGSPSLGRKNAKKWRDEHEAAMKSRSQVIRKHAAAPVVDRKVPAAGRDAITTLGAFVVGVAALVSSWAGWMGLAESAGWTQHIVVHDVTLRLSWLLPVAVDVYAVVAARVWIRLPGLSAATRRFAAGSTIAGVALGVLANVTFHLASHPTGKLLYLVAIVVAALPPIMLAVVAHLAALVAKDRARAGDSR